MCLLWCQPSLGFGLTFDDLLKWELKILSITYVVCELYFETFTDGGKDKECQDYTLPRGLEIIIDGREWPVIYESNSSYFTNQLISGATHSPSPACLAQVPGALLLLTQKKRCTPFSPSQSQIQVLIGS